MTQTTILVTPAHLKADVLSRLNELREMPQKIYNSSDDKFFSHSDRLDILSQKVNLLAGYQLKGKDEEEFRQNICNCNSEIDYCRNYLNSLFVIKATNLVSNANNFVKVHQSSQEFFRRYKF